MKQLQLFLITVILLSICILHANEISDIEIVKQRVVKGILKQTVDDHRVSELIQSINANGSWPDINYTDVSRTGFKNRYHLDNMELLSLAYQTESSKYFQNKIISKLLNQSLKFWCENDFICDNWWYNQVFTPTKLVNILLLMDDKIESDLKSKALEIASRGHLNAPGARPGGDRMKFGGIDAKRRLVIGDDTVFAEIMQTINNEIKFNTGGRGMQHDYSFHHHYDRVNTTYSYGSGYANIFAEWAAYVADTKYAFSKDKIEQLIDYYLDGICKQAVYGIYHEKGAMNRGVSRKESFEPLSINTPLRLLKTTDYRKEELKKIIALRKGEIEPQDSFARFYWQSEHFVFQRPEFYTSVRMYSVRNQNMEYPHNSEGIKNHHKGDGANFLSIKGDEYLNIWPVYDWQKIPGATILQKPELPPENKVLMPGVTKFVGAVTDGIYGAVTFDFISPHDFTRARKGWFFFDNAYVCLGAGIESPKSKFPVVTTIDQTLLQGNVTVSTKDRTNNLERGEHKIDNTKWVFHNGTGYLFPDSTILHITNQTQQGKWTDINKQSSSPKELVTKDVFTLWIDHGVRPQGNKGGFDYASTIPKDIKYQYTVIPVTTPEDMNDVLGIKVLINNRNVQAVKDYNADIVQAIFYHAGAIEISKGIILSVDSPGAVMVKINGSKVEEITVSDPSRILNRMHLKISGVDALTVELPQGVYAGKSVEVKL